MQKLVSTVYQNPLLQDRLSLRRAITFESYTNLGTTNNNLFKPLGNLSITKASVGDLLLAPTAVVRKPYCTIKGKGKGKGNRAEQFCIYRTLDSANVPTIIIEYKALHKLSQDEVVISLASKIQPARDIINKEAKGFIFVAKALTTTIIT